MVMQADGSLEAAADAERWTDLMKRSLFGSIA